MGLLQRGERAALPPAKCMGQRAPPQDDIQKICSREAAEALLLGAPARHRASGATIILQIAVEPRLSPTSPITARVIGNRRPGMQKAEEHMPRGTNHNARMPAPNHKIPRFRLRNALKAFHAVVEIAGTHIGIWKSGLFV